MHDLWTVQTGHNLGTFQEKVPTTIALPISGADTIQKIAGTIPPGLRLEGSNLTGTPFQVSRSTQYEFCLRAKHDTGIQDRTSHSKHRRSQMHHMDNTQQVYCQ